MEGFRVQGLEFRAIGRLGFRAWGLKCLGLQWLSVWGVELRLLRAALWGCSLKISPFPNPSKIPCAYKTSVGALQNL